MDRPDDTRANDPSTIGKPGDPLMDPKTEPGYVLLGLGLVTFALALIAAANHLMGWMAVALAICVISIVAGLAWVLYERGRMKEAMRNTPRRVSPRLRRLWRSSDGA